MSRVIHHMRTLGTEKSTCGKTMRWLNKYGTAYHNLSAAGPGFEIVNCKKCLKFKPEQGASTARKLLEFLRGENG